MDISELQGDAQKQEEERKSKMNLEDIQKLGKEVEDLNNTIDIKMAELKELQDKKSNIEETLLPAGMQDLGLTRITLESGGEVELQEIITGSINDANREKAHTWLRDHEFGDIIKNVVNVSFGKEEDEYARQLRAMLQKMSNNGEMKFGSVEQKESVHPSTLKAFIKERISNGEELPHETFGVHIFQRVKFNKPKRAKV